eukprot:2766677-Pleurochrysis_carterae.AAC.4
MAPAHTELRCDAAVGDKQPCASRGAAMHAQGLHGQKEQNEAPLWVVRVDWTARIAFKRRVSNALARWLAFAMLSQTSNETVRASRWIEKRACSSQLTLLRSARELQSRKAGQKDLGGFKPFGVSLWN